MSVLPVILNFSEDFNTMDMNPWMKFSCIPREFKYIHKMPRHQMKPFKHQSPFKLHKKLQSEEKEDFQVIMDMKHFKPEEISVRAVDDHVVVEAKHEEREDDNSFISRHFVRRYTLPKDCNANELVSKISSNGILTVSAPPLPKSQESKERVIEIQKTGSPHLSLEDSQDENKQPMQN